MPIIMELYIIIMDVLQFVNVIRKLTLQTADIFLVYSRMWGQC